jgi:hypothetical protein
MQTYLITDEHARAKIGKSKNPQSRLRAFQTGNGSRLTIEATIPGDHESKLHAVCERARVVTGGEEWYAVEVARVEFFGYKNWLFRRAILDRVLRERPLLYNFCVAQARSVELIDNRLILRFHPARSWSARALAKHAEWLEMMASDVAARQISVWWTTGATLERAVENARLITIAAAEHLRLASEVNS